ncbi:MAG: hypothetical protein HYZ00_02440, partial [Candidatus Hydrogenedentes bacterium]|nr:hypothetical protein [Candidatus Hydrogenedentota bacterium]
MSGVFIPARLVICVACAAAAVSVLVSGAFADSASSSTIELDDNTLLRLKWEQVSKNDELFSRLYELKCVPDVSAIHQDLSVQHFILREGFRYKSAMLLETAFVFEGRGKRLILDSQLPRIGDLKWEKDPAGAFFVIADFSGGNCWIGNPWYIISLETRHFLALLGRVGDVNKKDDGTLELSWTESRLETSPWLGHADSPYAKFYIAVKNTSLIADSRRNRQNFASALTR